MATREYEFVVGPETSTIPTAGTPTNDDDVLTKAWSESRFVGGKVAVANIAALKAIPASGTTGRRDNDLIYVDTALAVYRFDSGSSDTGDDDIIVEPDSGSGRWILVTKDVTKPLITKETGAGTEVSGFQAPSSLAADIIYTLPGADGTSGQFLSTNGSKVLSWGDASVSIKGESTELSNLTLTASVGSSALTIAIKNKAGNDPSSDDPCYVGMRDDTLTNGLFYRRSITSSLSITVPSGATLGTYDSVEHDIYIYLVDSDGSGTIKLAVSHARIFEEGSLHTTTAIDAGSDSACTLYSDAAYTSKPIRLIGRLRSTQTTAGTWNASPSELTIIPFKIINYWKRINLSGSYLPDGTSGLITSDDSNFIFNNIIIGQMYRAKLQIRTNSGDWGFSLHNHSTEGTGNGIIGYTWVGQGGTAQVEVVFIATGDKIFASWQGWSAEGNYGLGIATQNYMEVEELNNYSYTASTRW